MLLDYYSVEEGLTAFWIIVKSWMVEFLLLAFVFFLFFRSEFQFYFVICRLSQTFGLPRTGLEAIFMTFALIIGTVRRVPTSL